LRWAFLIPLGLLALGSVGYRQIEGDHWSYFDGFYMTAITITTIGYGETHSLTLAGRAFSVFLAFGGIFSLGFLATETLRAIVTGEIQGLLGRHRMEEELGLLSGHRIVCGYGRMGKIVCEDLDRSGIPFVVIDNAAPISPWPYQHGILLTGNATEDEVLRRAGAERASALITAVGSDADNLYITLSARLMNPELTIVARAEEAEAEAKLRRVGANNVVSPYLAGGHRAVQAVLRPTALHFLEMTTRPEFQDVQIEEIRIHDQSALVNQNFRDARLVQDFGVIVVGYQHPNGELKYAPHGDTVIESGAVLIALGRRLQLDLLEQIAQSAEPIKP
jgi:voltage-gated potassium channel